MPPIIALLPTIAAVAGLAGTGISVGEALSQGGGPSAASQEQSASKIQQELAQKEAAQQRTQAVLSATPDAIERTGGSLTDAGTQSFINSLAGYGYGGTSGSGGSSPSSSSSGNPFAATLDTLGAPGGNQPSSVGDILKQLTAFQGGGGSPGGNISGGAQPQPLAEATGRFELASPFVT